MLNGRIVGALAAAVLCAAGPCVGQPVWHPQDVDASGSVGTFSSVKLDSPGRPHISYYDAAHGTLKYARWTGSRWIIETVDTAGDVGQYTSLVLDPGDLPHISYYDATNKALKYAHWNGSAWAIQTVDHATGHAIGQYTSIALDSSQAPSITYYHVSHSELWIARKSGSSWTRTRVDSGDAGQYTSLVLDSADVPHISYYDVSDGSLKHAWKTGISWHTETVDNSGDVGRWTSIAVTGFNSPRISYYDVTNSALKFARTTGAGWDTETVDNTADVGAGTALDVDSFENPQIVYYDATHLTLRYARFNGGGWDVGVADASPGSGQYASMVLDDRDLPHATYATAPDGIHDNLRYSTPTGGWFFWSRAPGYGADGVKPNSGAASSTVFRFQVVYQDVLGTAPVNPKVVISRNGQFYRNLRLKPVGSTPNFQVGADMKASTTLPAGAYTYRFRASSSDGSVAGGLPAQPSVGPVVTGAAGLVLSSVTATPTMHDGVEIRLRLSTAATVEAKVINMAGRRVRRLTAGEERAAGVNVLLWDGRDDGGLGMPAGRYVVEIRARAADGQEARGLCAVSLGAR